MGASPCASPFASSALPGVTTRRVRATSTRLRESNVGANAASKAGSPAPKPPYGDSTPSQHQEQHDDGSGIENCAHPAPQFVAASALANLDREPPADVLNLSTTVETRGKACPRGPSQTASNQEEHPSLVPMRTAILLQQLMNDSGMNAGSSFMAGFALGAQQAHTKALEQVQTSGALKMSLLAAHHELRRVQNRIRKIELENAYSTGHVTFSLKSLDHRLAAAERSSTLQDRALDRALMRLDSLGRAQRRAHSLSVIGCFGIVSWAGCTRC